MAGIPGRAPRRYTQDEKVALVSEIDRRLRSTGGSLYTIASDLGTTGTSYVNWLKAGVTPAAAPPAAHRIYSAAEREHFMAEVDRMRGEGQNLIAACRTLAISDKSYRKWKADSAPPATMRPVEITALVPVSSQAVAIIRPPDPRTLTLIAPGGYRIEGLSTESAAELLRALA